VHRRPLLLRIRLDGARLRTSAARIDATARASHGSEATEPGAHEGRRCAACTRWARELPRARRGVGAARARAARSDAARGHGARGGRGADRGGVRGRGRNGGVVGECFILVSRAREPSPLFNPTHGRVLGARRGRCLSGRASAPHASSCVSRWMRTARHMHRVLVVFCRFDGQPTARTIRHVSMLSRMGGRAL